MRAWPLVLVGILGCADGPKNVTYREIGLDEVVGVDDGLTPSDVLGRLAARDYDVTADDAPNLPTYAPFRVNPGTQWASAFAVTETSAVDGSFVSNKLVLHVPVRVRSSDGALDLTSTVEIEATSLDQLTWSTYAYEGDALELPWAIDERAAAWEQAGCEADDPDLGAGTFVLLPTGSAADGGPSKLELAAVWPDGACTTRTSLEVVGLVAAE
jgi:hypothetical protein